MQLIVNEEYLFLDDAVKVIEIHGAGPNREVVIESRFGNRATVWEDDLSEKPQASRRDNYSRCASGESDNDAE